MLNHEISKQVLTIGCDYKTTKGGISSVIGSYSQIYSPFNFIATTQTKSKLHNLIFLFISLIRFILKCFSNDIKIIHIHTASNTSFRRKAIFINIASIFNKKIILHIHGGKFHVFYEKNKSFVENVLNKVDTIVALSKQWEVYFKEIVGCKNVEVIANIVDTPKDIKKIKRNSNPISGVFLGNMNPQKGIYDIIDMADNYKESLKGKLVLHIGGNGETDKVQQLINDRNLNDIIIYEGWVDYERKAELLANADFFLLPSYIEGLPISILEAMSYGLPVISTPVGGIPEILLENRNGFLINPGDKEALFRAINRFINKECDVETMGAESFRRVQPHLPKNVSCSLAKIYKRYII